MWKSNSSELGYLRNITSTFVNLRATEPTAWKLHAIAQTQLWRGAPKFDFHTGLMGSLAKGVVGSSA